MMEKKPIWLGAAIVWVGAVFVWLGMFLSWETFTGLFGALSASGFGVAGLEDVNNGFGQPLLIHHTYLYLIPVCALLAALFVVKAAKPLNKGSVNYGPWLLLALALVAVVCCVLFYSGIDADRRILIISAMAASDGATVSIFGALLMTAGAVVIPLSRSAKANVPAYPSTASYNAPIPSPTSQAADGAILSHLPTDEETRLA